MNKEEVIEYLEKILDVAEDLQGMTINESIIKKGLVIQRYVDKILDIIDIEE